MLRERGHRSDPRRVARPLFCVLNLVVGAIACAPALVSCRSDPAPVPQHTTTDATVPSSEDVQPCAPPRVLVVGPEETPADTTLVMLHGYGADAADLTPVARALAHARARTVVLVPDGCDPSESGPKGRQWWSMRDASDRGSRVKAAAVRVSRFVDAELRSRGMPRDRIVWAGFSQGAMLAQWMAVHATPSPLAVVSFSGRFDDDSPIGPAVATPILLVHGARDAVVPFAESERAQRSPVARGAKVERVDRPMMAHAIDDESLAAAVAFLARNLGAR